MTHSTTSLPRHLLPLLAALAVLLPLSGCQAKAERAEPAAMVAPAAVDKSRAADAKTADTGAAQPAIQRQLIKTAELSIEVGSYDDARRAVDAVLAELDGYVADAEVQHESGTVSSASLTVRVPAKSLNAFLARCSELGAVMSESVATADVTEQYYDAQARLTNARRLEQRLLELLAARTDGVKDLLEVERELARVREQIETLEGRVRVYDSQVAMSRVSLQVTTRDRFTAGQPVGLATELWRTTVASFTVLRDFVRGSLLAMAGLLPWTPLLLLFFYIGRRALRRVRA